jgi:hypothetical protein
MHYCARPIVAGKRLAWLELDQRLLRYLPSPARGQAAPSLTSLDSTRLSEDPWRVRTPEPAAEIAVARQLFVFADISEAPHTAKIRSDPIN